MWSENRGSENDLCKKDTTSSVFLYLRLFSLVSDLISHELKRGGAWIGNSPNFTPHLFQTDS